ncbi:Hypp9377 [Branchiostoma lanceolatum]|uniref:Hypp9377 protein n=1 Tax=Branchiostoma lanceolatum TaxID=7740 RepID=A0A8S4MLL4_BRALA|nr:Hypp9377 [Branchiostoma lanceolatum]
MLSNSRRTSRTSLAAAPLFMSLSVSSWMTGRSSCQLAWDGGDGGRVYGLICVDIAPLSKTFSITCLRVIWLPRPSKVETAIGEFTRPCHRAARLVSGVMLPPQALSFFERRLQCSKAAFGN